MYLLVEAMSNESRVEVDKSEEVAQGWQHALSHMVSKDNLKPMPLPVKVTFVWLRTPWELLAFENDRRDPSRANAAAAYEPAGPPPTTRTLVYSGIGIVLCFVRMCSVSGRD